MYVPKLMSSIFRSLAYWGFGSCVAACSAALTALPLAGFKAPPDEADEIEEDDDEVVDGDEAFTREANGRVLPQPRDFTWEDSR